MYTVAADQNASRSGVIQRFDKAIIIRSNLTAAGVRVEKTMDFTRIIINREL